MNIGERTVNNALFNAVCGMLPLLLSFIFWPYIVAKLGDSSYGIFALVGSVIGYFALLDLGLGNAVVKYVAEYTGQQDGVRTREVIGVAFSIFAAAGLFGLLVILAIARILVTTLLKIPPELTYAAYHSFCAAALGFFFTMMVSLLTAIINGLNRYDISSVTNAAMGAVTTVGSVILLRIGFGLLAVVWLNVIIPAAAVFFYFILARRLLQGPVFHFRYTRAVFKQVFHFGMYSMLSRIADVCVRQLGVLIIGALLGVASVTYYVIPFTILNRLIMLLGRISIVIFPAISELQGQQRHDTIRDLYLTSSRIIFSFSAALIVPLLIFGPRFLHLWMTPEFAERSGTVLLILTTATFINFCTYVPSFVVNGLGKPKISGIAAIANAAVFLILIVPGALWGGITGVAIAYAISTVTGLIFIWYVNNKVLGLTLSRLVTEVYARPLLAGVIAAAPLLLIPQQRIPGLFLMLLVMAGGMGLYIAVALLSGVYQQRERSILAAYLAGIRNRLRLRKTS